MSSRSICWRKSLTSFFIAFSLTKCFSLISFMLEIFFREKRENFVFKFSIVIRKEGSFFIRIIPLLLLLHSSRILSSLVENKFNYFNLILCEMCACAMWRLVAGTNSFESLWANSGILGIYYIFGFICFSKGLNRILMLWLISWFVYMPQYKKNTDYIGIDPETTLCTWKVLDYETNNCSLQRKNSA